MEKDSFTLPVRNTRSAVRRSRAVNYLSINRAAQANQPLATKGFFSLTLDRKAAVLGRRMNVGRRAEEQGSFEDGRLSGMSLNEQVSDCPFSHLEIGMREIWLQGFAFGRALLPTGEEQMAAEFDAFDFVFRGSRQQGRKF